MGIKINYTRGQVLGSHGVKYIIDTYPKLVSGRNVRHAIFECPHCFRYFITRPTLVKTAWTKSCGCHKGVLIRLIHTQHGLNGTRLYNTWLSMRSRCTKPKHIYYLRYGGRGITVYNEWLDSPIPFVNYCKTLPRWDDPTLSLDRIDNDGNYEPGNLRFVTKIIQANNKNTIQKNNTTGYTGIGRENKCNKFTALIKYNKIKKHIGIFMTIVEAVEARNKYIIENNLPLHKVQAIH